MKTAKRGLAALTCMLLLAVFALPLHVFAISGSMYNGEYFEMTYSASGFEVTKEDPPEKNNHDRIHRYYGTCHNGTISVSGTFTIIGEWCPKPTIHFSGSAYGYGTNIMDFREMCPTEYVAVDDSTGSYSFEVPVTSEYKQVVIELSAGTSDRSDPPETVFGNWPSGHVHLQLENLDFTGESDTGGGVYPQNNYDNDEGYEDYEEPVIEDDDTVIDPGDTYVDASGDAGEEQGVSIPTIIGSAVAGGAILIGGKLVLKKKKNKKSRRSKKEKRPKKAPPRSRAPEPVPERVPEYRPEPESTPEPEQKQEPEEEQEEEQKPQSTYQMRVHKDFGDTITPGERLPIFARMVEITPDGQEKLAPDLTQKIRIYAKSYLRVDNEMMAGEYKAAYVTAPQTDQFPETAEVIFEFAGIYKVHMKFKIDRMEILFGQENLTLPALQNEEADLPFVVLGASPESSVEVTLSKPLFKVDVRPTEDPRLFIAHIREAVRNKEEAGTCEYCKMTITVTSHSKGGSRTCRGELPLLRFHMGLVAELDYINCYAVLAPEAKGKDNAKLVKEDYRPALSKGHMILYDWDRESHCILRLAPTVKEFSLKATTDKQRQLVEKLDVRCVAVDKIDDDGRLLNLWCEKAVLDPPSRFTVDASITVSYREKLYSWTGIVSLHSQPLRDFRDDDSLVSSCKASDAHITERLKHIQKQIRDHGVEKQLFPMVKLIDAMLEGYNISFGYDLHQVERVRNAYGRFVSGESVGMNGDPAEPLTLADYACMAVQATVQSAVDGAVEFDQNRNFFTRFVLGWATSGYYNHVINVATVAKIMETSDTVTDAVVMGSKIYVADYVMGKVVEKVCVAAKAAKPYAASLLKEFKGKVKIKIPRVASFFGSKVGEQSLRAIQKDANAAAAAKVSAKAIVASGKSGLKMTGAQQTMLELEKNISALSRQKVADFGGAEAHFRMTNTPAARALYQAKFDAVNADPLARIYLRSLPVKDPARKAFAQTMRHYNEAAARTKWAQHYSQCMTSLAAGEKDLFNKNLQKTINNSLYTEDVYLRMMQNSDQSAWAFLDPPPVPTGAEAASAIRQLDAVGKMALASALNAAIDPVNQKELLAMSAACRQERVQLVLQRFNTTAAANVSRMSRGKQSAISDRVRQGAALCECTLIGSQEMITPTELDALLETQGISLNELSDEIGRDFDDIDS